MARKLKDEQVKAPADMPVETSRSNLTGFDGQAIVEDVQRIVTMTDDAKENMQPVKEAKNTLKGERGYHMGAFGTICGISRKELIEQRDWWMTIKAWAVAQGLDDPDLVDRMEMADA